MKKIAISGTGSVGQAYASKFITTGYAETALKQMRM